MSEHSTGAKLRRAMVLRLLSLLGPARLAQLVTLNGPEQAALAANRQRSYPANRTVVFAIPLVGRHLVGDWSVINAALARTLAAFQAQSSDNWRLMICGQDRPDCLETADTRVHFIPFTDNVEGHDKLPKLQMLARALPQFGLTHGYYMPFDGDDILAPESVARMQAENAPGYLVEQGYILNAGTGELARTAAQSWRDPSQKAFWKFCGSCAAFPFDLSDSPTDIGFFQALAQQEHRYYPYLAALANMPLSAQSAPEVLYMLNHGENFGARRGRGAFKMRFVTRHALTQSAPVKARFGLTSEV